MKDSIEKSTHIAAPRAAVWAALVDAQAFGTWFLCRFDGPFVIGERLGAEITGYGHEGMPFWIEPVEIAPQERLVFDWPAGEEVSGDAPVTRVTFTLAEEGAGTRVTVVESGFLSLPPEVAERKYPDNEGGWTIQLQNLTAHVAA
ncbi:SRPBCC domain-containing protein [Oceanicola sp. 502str15]|uniref:SRPBCC domain-containing protein n=1 Tax=Oceanicola sp. 502str15 TaxID=2696061 RepID=UPI0020956DBE|nr:SRPBCC domain-containing protein [Oceanicola sp. 502str15]MCO6385118.1 vanillate O-demethylase oxidoreductase VanB [Oceanicola sp. 502str15]